MKRTVTVAGIVFGAIITALMLQARTRSSDTYPQRAIPKLEFEAQASGAITSTQDAIDITLGWLPSSEHPHDAIARLVPGWKVGRLLHACLNYANERPYWVVGVLTDATWDFGFEDYTVDGPAKNAGAEGVYNVLDANFGEQSAFGDLVNTSATDTEGAPAYADIENLEDEELEISYQTPESITGVSTSAPTSDIVAVADAVGTAVVQCEATWWPPTATPAITSTPTRTPTATPTRTSTPCAGLGC